MMQQLWDMPMLIQSPTIWQPLFISAVLKYLGMMFAIPILRHRLSMWHLLACRLFSHSDKGGPLSLLHELDLCVVGVSSLAFGGTHHTDLAVGSMEATTHMVRLTHSDDGLPEPPQVQSFFFLFCCSVYCS